MTAKTQNHSKTSSKNSLSLTALKKFLTENIVFNPREPGLMKPIVDIQNPSYYKIRAKEAIDTGDLILAIRLLILARLTDGPYQNT